MKPINTKGETVCNPTIHMNLESMYILPDKKRIGKNGTVYTSTHFAGRRVKAIIFEEE